MKRIIGLLSILFALIALSPATMAQMVIETIEIRNRPASDILPVIKPLVAPAGSVSAMMQILVIRTTADNMDEIKTLVAELDEIPEMLAITVRQASRTMANDHGGNLRHRHGRTGVRFYSSHADSDMRGNYQIRTLEGHAAWIKTGQLIPLAHRYVTIDRYGRRTFRDGIQYHSVDSGFYAVPRVHGDTVTLHIQPHQSRMTSTGPGMVRQQGADTVVTGRLGTWLEIGGVEQDEDRDQRGIAWMTGHGQDSDYRIQLKVERIK